MVDRLEKLFKMQKEFDSMIKDNVRGEDAIIRLCTALIHETIELQQHTNWKWWKKPTEPNPEEMKEELVDIWHFLLSLTIKMDVTPDDLMEAYYKKHAKNIVRQKTGY